MIVATLTILGPLGAAALILAIRRYPHVLALLGAAVSAIAALATLIRVEGGARFESTLPGLPDYPLVLLVDPQASLLLTVVAAVNLLILIYAAGYMESEAGQPRFYSGMGLFAAAMQALVLAGDWILFLAAWEIIGFASYLLIGFWYQRSGIGSAATRAFLTTRSADLGLYGGVAMLVTSAGTTRIAETLDTGGSLAVVASVALLIAAMGKSAQVPFHGWLQSAMAGPTPVSALLHSATLVAAGVVLLTRISPLLTGDARILVGVGGGATILIAGIVALAQPDLKRLLAASTSSQVGFMFLGIAAASPFAALFHLTAHAAMKSALFLGAGVFQHARDTTNLDSLRGIGRGHRRVYLGMVLAGLALVGIPPLAGFWSKEAVIAAAFHAETSWLWGPLVLAGSLLTGMYVARALRILWDGDPDEARVPGINWMSTGLAGLAFLAVTVGLGGPWLSRFLGEELPGSLLSLVLGLGAALAGLVAGWLGSDRVRLGAAFARAGDGFRLDSGFDGLVVRPVLEVAATLDRLDLQIEHRLRGAVRFVSELEARACIEPRLEQAVRGAGARTLMIGRLAAMTDDLGISGLIGQLVNGVRIIGARSRRLQTGLIHRELLVTAGGALIVLVFILLS